MALCKEAGRIYAKIGMSDDPIKRLDTLLTGCPLIPSVLAVVELPNRRIAYKTEAELHCALAEWKRTREWFRFEETDKPRFNAAWQEVFRHFASPSRSLSWTKIHLKPLLAEMRKRRHYAQHRYMNAGGAYQDFKRASPR